MNRGLYLLVCLALFGCNNQERNGREPSTRPSATGQAATQVANPNGYKARLEAFLDSVGSLPLQPLAEQAALLADSVFYHQQQPANQVVSPGDLRILRQAARKGFIAVKTARRIFHNPAISYDCTTKSVMLEYKTGITPVDYYPFGHNGTDEFALCIGGAGHCSSASLYFFKKNRIIAKQNGHTHYGLGLESYKGSDGKTVVYHQHEFTDGSGIWWNNYFFYKYEGNTLIPVLNELGNGNLLSPSPWGVRSYWLESFVEKTNPLTIKMVYHVQLPDTAKPDYGPRMIDDSTTVEYTWNEQLKKLEGQYGKSKITKPQILSYYVEDTDLLFINSYYQTIKKALHNSATQATTLVYLNEVKNYINRQRMEKAKK